MQALCFISSLCLLIIIIASISSGSLGVFEEKHERNAVDIYELNKNEQQEVLEQVLEQQQMVEQVLEKQQVLEHVLQEQQIEIQQLKKTTQQQNQEITTLKNLHTRQHSSPVGFTAQHNAGVASYAAGEGIPFNEVLNNWGGHYNNVSSTFACPALGIYIFTVSLATESRLSVNLYRDEAILFNIDVDEEESRTQLMGSNTCVVTCSQGQEVKVVAYSSSVINFNDDNSMMYKRNTFAGFLLALTS